eukprot:274750_1
MSIEVDDDDDEMATMHANALNKQPTITVTSPQRVPRVVTYKQHHAADTQQNAQSNVSPLVNINGYNPQSNHNHHQSPPMHSQSPYNHNQNSYNHNKTYQSPHQSPHQNLSPYTSRDTSPVELIDNQGNVHANKYYNVTRNHNLSNASKMSNMSEMPSIYQVNNQIKNSLSTTVNSRNFGPNHIVPPTGQGYHPHHKGSNVSNATDISRMLWDFGDQGSMMTLKSDVSENCDTNEQPEPTSFV